MAIIPTNWAFKVVFAKAGPCSDIRLYSTNMMTMVHFFMKDYGLDLQPRATNGLSKRNIIHCKSRLKSWTAMSIVSGRRWLSWRATSAAHATPFSTATSLYWNDRCWQTSRSNFHTVFKQNDSFCISTTRWMASIVIIWFHTPVTSDIRHLVHDEFERVHVNNQKQLLSVQ